MSSTKRKQIKPQKIFNSKKIDSISANSILQQETSTNWRVITDLSSSSSSSPPSSTTTSMKESKHSIESQLNNNNNHHHNMSQLVNNDYFNHFLYQQAIADSTTCMNPNLMQSIEKIIIMNLTPYLFGMINNQQQQQHQQLETYSSAFSTVNHNNTELINNFKKKNDLLCSCGTSFDSFEILNQHLKQTNHKMIEVKSNQNDYIFNNNNSKNNSKHNHKSVFSSASSSVCLSPSQSPLTPTSITTTNKMVRGQEEWVKNSRDNNFISQILKCLECSASFDTLADLSLHMLNTNHFSKFHNNNNNNNQLQNINNLTTITNNRTNKSNNESINHVSSQSSSSSSSSSSNKQHHKRSEQQPQANLFNNTSNVGCRLKNSITNQSDLKCLICNKKFDNNNNNNNNKSSSTELPPLVKLIQHLQNAHKVTNVCTNCGAIFNNTDDLQKHLLEETYHHYHNNIQNINNSLTNKNLKRNNSNNNNSSNSNLNINKRIKSTCETSSSPTTLTAPLPLPIENDYINNLKLNLFLNKQNEYNSSKQTTSNSISPSSSSTSSSYSSSSNSSSPSFLISSGNNETNLSNFKDKIESHPLLALQMFVNNSNSTLTENKTKVIQQQYSIPPPPPLMPNESVAAAAAAATAAHKLPAKKRPYIEESLSNEEEEVKEGEGKNNNLFKLFKNNNNYKRSVEDLNNTLAKENKKCHSPLNLLQKMQIGLDDYLMR
jgi:hypothetical protein